MIYYKKDNQDIVIITLDMSGRRVNIINHEIAQVLLPALKLLEKSAKAGSLRGVIITSAKPTFLAGGDLDYLHKAENPQDVFEHTEILTTIFRRIEQLGVPVVAAMNGSALGSGYELALACHYRIAWDSPNTLIGLPEVTLGMMPGGGGISRLTWVLGYEKAFDILSKGRKMHVKEALQRGLIDKIIVDKSDLIREARDWILSEPDIVKPWDKSDSIPTHINPQRLKNSRLIAAMNADIARKTYHNYPAVQAIFNAMVEGAFVDFETATRICSRYFTSLISSKTCLNMTKAFWYDLNKINKGASRPKGFGRFRARKIAIIGAGIMGSGIAYTSALAGIEVVLKDISVSIAEQGKEQSRQALDRLVNLGKMTTEQKEEILERIHTTQHSSDFEDCDLVIETVFENPDLKKRIARDTEMHIHRDCFIASNTSTLSISDLSEACAQPKNYIGMHFFSPVATVPLVEIIYGEDTSKETISRSFDFVRQIGKIPIIVKDEYGFYTYRVYRSFLLEGLALLQEGQLPNAIENAARLAGMPDGPLALADKLSLPKLLEFEINTHQQKDHPGLIVAEKMVKELNRKGKARQAGFYDYNKQKKVEFWAGLEECFPQDKEQLDQQLMTERLLFVQCLEAVRCLEENILQTNAEANLGSIYGWGFAPFKGGVLQYINDYGISEFVARAQELESLFGKRFELPALLKEMNEKQLNFN
ncbi:MAG: 3-hydroxyacyl-CoA dehydrogenase [Aureispira sp.]|nr:3-hydroxyacyl-CoA dehydrogenase [Aureispira sp.]